MSSVRLEKGYPKNTERQVKQNIVMKVGRSTAQLRPCAEKVGTQGGDRGGTELTKRGKASNYVNSSSEGGRDQRKEGSGFGGAGARNEKKRRRLHCRMNSSATLSAKKGGIGESREQKNAHR